MSFKNGIIRQQTSYENIEKPKSPLLPFLALAPLALLPLLLLTTTTFGTTATTGIISNPVTIVRRRRDLQKVK